MGESSFVQVSFAHFFFLFNIFTAISGENIFCSPVFALIFSFSWAIGFILITLSPILF